jgi:GAF domain-containing protein
VFRIAGYAPEALFQTTDDGQPMDLAWNALVFERIPWYATNQVQRELAAAFAGVFLLGSLAGPLWLVVRRGRCRHASPAGWARVAGVSGWLVSVLDLGFLVGLSVLLSHPYELGIEYGVPVEVEALLCVPLISSAVLVGVLAGTVRLWIGRTWSIGARLAYTLLGLTAVAFVPFLAYWNLLGFRW